jgi:hypothetical protein
MDLRLGKLYFVKWSGIDNMGNKHLFVIKGELVKPFDDRYCRDDIDIEYIKYRNEYELPPYELIPEIFNDNGEEVEYAFDHSLYPYSHFKNAIHPNNCNIVLFQILSIEKVVDYGIKKSVNTSLFVNQDLIGRAFIIDTEEIQKDTLIWVDLNEVSDIIDAFDIKPRLIQRLSLPTDVTQYNINEYYTGPPQRGGRGKNKSKRVKSKVRRNSKTRITTRFIS